MLLGLTVKTGQEQGDLRRHQLAIYLFKVGFIFVLCIQLKHEHIKFEKLCKCCGNSLDSYTIRP